MTHRVVHIEGGKRVEQAGPINYLRRLWTEARSRYADRPEVIMVCEANLAASEPAPVAVKPRRKGLGPKQLRWLRTNIEPFKDMEARALASRGVAKEKGK